MSHLSFLFGDLHDERARRVAAFASELPHLCRGSLAACDLGIHSSDGLFVCVARFRGEVPDAVRTRLAFWAWHVGGSQWTALGASPPGEVDAAAGSPLAGCDAVLPEIGPALLGCAVSSLLGRLPSGAGPDREKLALRLALGTNETAGLSFDRRRQTLLVPSPLPLPPGDDVALRILLPDGEWMEAQGVVAATRAAGEQGPGSPAGFVVGLEMLDARAADALETHAGPPSAERRRAPRYTVRARAAVSPAAEAAPSRTARLGYSDLHDFGEDYVENLSQSGAFVRTRKPFPAGARIQLCIELPGGAEMTAPAVVVYRNDRGVGARFDVDRAGEAAVADALAQIAARRRRALVVDDDALARRMLGDALAERGFEVFAASDGVDGLRTLTDQLLGLDILVTDLRMPGLDGEQLLRVVREAGGEQDLAIVVASGFLDADAEMRLLAAGADAVLPKARGAAALADAAEKAVLRRGPGRRREAGPGALGPDDGRRLIQPETTGAAGSAL